MAILNNNPLVGASGNQGGYNINNSLRLRSSASAYLNRTPSASNRKTWTWSAWVKRGTLGVLQEFFSAYDGTAGQTGNISFEADDTLRVYTGGNSGTRGIIGTSAVFRDPSAWYHIVAVLDTTQATAANRVKLYVNGNLQTITIVEQVTQNFEGQVNGAWAHRIGSHVNNIRYFDGYMADVNFIDGSAKTPSDFGETDTTTGVWKPKAYSGTYGTNGFYLKFSDIATTSGSNAGLGKDFSGNANYWTTNNISVTAGVTYDAMTDSPTLTSATVANYATLNPNLRQTGTGQAPTSANLKLTANTTGYSQVCCATIASPSGKFYWEVTVNGGVGTIGIADSNNSAFTSVVCSTSATTSDPNEYTWGWSVNLGSGNKKHNNVSTSYGSAASSGDVYMCAVDIDNSKVWWGKNGTWFASGSPTAGTNAAYTNVSGNIIPYLSPTDGSGYTNDVNFGQRPFNYSAPSGFLPLNTFNLPTPTILQGNKYMDATLWTGDNANPRAITNTAGFQPDLVWIKARNSAQQHVLNDSVRGTGTSKGLSSNTTDAEGSANILLYGATTAFNSNGFSVGGGTSNQAFVNYSPYTYVGWQWQAGQGSTSSNTSGSITSTVSVNTTAGFSVVTYTGTGANATVGHGLGVAPKFFVVKSRSSTGQNWQVYTATYGKDYVFQLDLTSAIQNYSNYWGTSNPTPDVFGVNGSYSGINANGVNYVAYCWAEIAGFSRFGSYTGNGSTDGPMVYCNFSPRFLMVKRTDTTGNWRLIDTARYTYNTMGNELYPNSSAAEAYNAFYDVLSNGFKMRNTNTDLNASGGTYIYMAFASNPFRNSNAF